MSPVFVLLTMIFLHVLDDFFLQSCGFLARGKQREWWKNEAPDEKYRYDYLACLFMHGMSWAFMIMLPLAWYYDFNVDLSFGILMCINAFLHMFVDDLKANQHVFNLIQDQTIHMCQIVETFILMML